MNTPNVEFLNARLLQRAYIHHTLPAANGVVRCATIGACSENALLAAGA